MKRPQHLGLGEFRDIVETAVTDQPFLQEHAPRAIPSRLPSHRKALDRGAPHSDRIPRGGRQPLHHLRMKPHGGVNFCVGRHQRPQRQSFGLEGRHGGDLYTTLPGRDGGETAEGHIRSKGDRPQPKETEKTNTQNKLNRSPPQSPTPLHAAPLPRPPPPPPPPPAPP